MREFIQKWRKARLLRWLVAIILGAASLFMRYRVIGEDGRAYRVYGISFPAFAFDAQQVGFLPNWKCRLLYFPNDPNDRPD
jgi:hypothetical protein